MNKEVVEEILSKSSTILVGKPKHYRNGGALKRPRCAVVSFQPVLQPQKKESHELT